MKPRRFAARAAILGLLVPLVCETAYYIHPYMAGAWMLWIWPSSIQLMVLQFDPPPYEVAIIIAESVALNVFLYGAIGWMIGFAYSRRRSARIRTLSP
jgi:hypothetical protein